MRPAAADRRLYLLAPDTGRVPESFSNARFDEGRHWRLLAQAQRLRGEIFLKDGAIEPWQLTPDGRYCVSGDEDSWHLLLLDAHGEVCGCARYFEHDNTVSFSRLGVRHAALAQSERWGQQFRCAIEADLALARTRDLAYVEVGSWALREDLRGSPEGIRIALGAYGLARNLGGCIGVTTATVRHRSSSILRRIGAASLQAGGSELAAYHDPAYNCEMNILRFDSRLPNPRYEAWIEQIREQICSAPVICRAAQQLGRPRTGQNSQSPTFVHSGARALHTHEALGTECRL